MNKSLMRGAMSLKPRTINRINNVECNNIKGSCITCECMISLLNPEQIVIFRVSLEQLAFTTHWRRKQSGIGVRRVISRNFDPSLCSEYLFPLQVSFPIDRNWVKLNKWLVLKLNSLVYSCKYSFKPCSIWYFF